LLPADLPLPKLTDCDVAWQRLKPRKSQRLGKKAGRRHDKNNYEEDLQNAYSNSWKVSVHTDFPESHAASFALLVYVSSWIKCYYPDVFATALLNSMPMGFYQPAQIVIDARKHGVEVRPVDINHSNWDNMLEEKSGKYCAVRLGFRQVKGLQSEDMRLLLDAREKPFQLRSFLAGCREFQCFA
jgi:DNA polymerase III alpha subunit